ncbi:NEW3 domain-containing protein [Natrinema sp. SYSU A 869]|uniref:COG1361 S-layer family protein n=1 Tax=Natrinema sp. SYSU A 869 TaxID=2871694 RepID=UPI001CA44193|nr:NEW3 domain-containing protein [Natrinema sp. SYSU A 869]
MSRRRVAVLALAIVTVVSVLAPLSITATMAQQSSGELTRGEPNLELVDSNPEVTPGTETTLEVEIKNDGTLRTGTQSNRVLTARGVTAELADADPFKSTGGEVAVGPIQDGTIATAPLTIDVPEDVEPGTHEIQVDIEYAYTNRVSDSSGVQQRLTKTETLDLRVTVPEEPRFDVSTVATDVSPGASGDVTMEIENSGGESANHTRVSVTGFGGVTIDGGTSENAIGDLAPNESTTTTVEASIAESTSATDKPIEATFTYEDESGIDRTSDPVRTTLSLGAAQSFSVRNLEDSLSVGYEGNVTGDVVNDGPRPVDDAVLIVEPMSDSLFVEDTRYALPKLKSGEAATFAYPVEVSGQADAGARQLQFTVEYTGSGDATLQDGPISKRVVVDDRTDEFSISDDGASVRQGETSDLVLEITNERPETVTNIDARLYTEGALDAPDDEAFVKELEPGESAEIPFEISAAADATVETHPVELDFEYDTRRGETVLSDVYKHPIEVEPSEDDGGGFPSLIVGVLGALAVSGIGIGLWLRQD